MNPNHDPKNGRFTTGSGGKKSKKKKPGYNPDFPNQMTTRELAAKIKRDMANKRSPITGRRKYR